MRKKKGTLNDPRSHSSEMVEGVRPSALADAAIASLVERHALEASSVPVYDDLARRFALFCEDGLGIADARSVAHRHVVLFIESRTADGRRPAGRTKRLRNGAVRLVYREGRRLALVEHDPTTDVVLPSLTHVSTRPLTDDEVALARLYAETKGDDSRVAIVWGLSESSARVSEVDDIGVDDVDLETQHVLIHGGARTEARRAPITPWAAAQLELRIAQLRRRRKSDAPLVPWDRVARPARPRNAVTMTVIEALRATGVHGEPAVRPASVAGWAGRRLWLQGATLEQVALALGMRSLDRVTEVIAYDWRSEAAPL